MALVLKDRVRDTTTTAGTGTVTLSGTAPTGFQNFSAIGNGNTTYYTISGSNEWEVGIGTYSSTGPTLSRDTVLESSNAGALVPFSAGTKDVFVTYPAERAISDGYGTLPVANGGTGQTSYTNGQLLIGNTTGNTLTKATLTQGSGVIITNGAGAITLASTRDFQEFTSSGTWTKPSGVSFVMVECWGAGGGGGSGARGAAATNRTGGGGGAGGSYTYRLFKASDLSATETVTIGAGGAGGAARTTDGASVGGANGGDTTFGSKLAAYGGRASTGSGNSTGGGVLGAPTGAGAGTAGQPIVASNANGQFGGASLNGASGFGGGSGASAAIASVELGGCSYQGGAGGGGGGQITFANATSAGTAGGFNAGVSGGGGAGGGSGTGTAGAAGTAIGMAGGGGGSGSGATGTTAGGTGGAGGIAAGGGGGGASTTGANSGAGGKGGDGYCRVYSW